MDLEKSDKQVLLHSNTKFQEKKLTYTHQYSSNEKKRKVKKEIVLVDLLCHLQNMYNCFHFKEEETEVQPKFTQVEIQRCDLNSILSHPKASAIRVSAKPFDSHKTVACGWAEVSKLCG